MNPRNHSLLPLAAVAGLALIASAGADTVIANFNTVAQAAVYDPNGIYSSTGLGSNTAPPFTFRYDISALGIGAADELLITVGSTANFSSAAGNGIAVVGGASNSHWDPSDPDLSFTIVVEDASNSDITGDLNIDLTGVGMRWGAGATATFAGQAILQTATLDGVDLATGQTAETSFTASRTGSVSLSQVQQLRFEITDPGSDVTAPTITGKSPADEAGGVAIDANLVATFDENIVLVDGGTITIRDLGPGPDVVITLPDDQVSISGAKDLVIDPDANLVPGNPYAVQISAHAVEDLATTPNAFAGILDDTTWNFGTAALDNTAPTITSKLPDDEATDVALDANLVATFDEDIALVDGGTITIRDLGPGSDVVITLPDDQVSISGTRDLVIDPDANLLPSNSYAVQISADAFEDLATTPNAFVGILDDATWNFSTVAQDLTAPAITGTSPADDAGSVLNDSNLVATFDEDIALVDGGTITIRDLGPGSDVVITLPDDQVSVSGADLIIDPTAYLVPDNPYAVQISADAVEDLATTPNAFFGILDDTTWNFSTLPGVRILANFTTDSGKVVTLPDGLQSSTILGGSNPSPFTFRYDISGLGIGAADELLITVATTGANLNSGGGNGIAVVGGISNAWWEATDGSLSFTVVIEDAGNNDITGDFNVDLTGASIRWDDAPAAPILTVAGELFNHSGVGLIYQGMNLSTGQTDETAFTASRTLDDVGQFQQLRFAISESAGGNDFSAWQALNSTLGGLDDDHDGDGVKNGVEFYLGGPNDTTGFTALPGVDNTAGTLSVTWTKASDYPGTYGTNFWVETSSTLSAGSWVMETLGGGNITITITGDDVKYTFPAGTRNFARLVVTGP